MRKKKSSLSVLVKKHLGIRFRKIHFLEASLLHPSYRNDVPFPHLEDFDRLEFFGDAILNFVICRKIYKTFPIDNEGMLSRLRSILVSRKILARIAKNLGFLKFIQIGKSLKNQPGFSKMKLLADAFEAFLAALYFDQGLAVTEKFILKHFDYYFNVKRLFRIDPNPKSMLQELCQKNWQKLPVYTYSTHPHGVEVTITAHEDFKLQASAKSRKEAEEKAARLLLKKLRQDLLSVSNKVSSGRKLRKIR